MKRKEKPLSVLLLSREHLRLYTPSCTEILALTFTGDAVKDLEVDNSKTLERQLTTWLEPLKLSEQPAILILAAETFFTFDSPNLEVSADDPAYQEFMSLMPFDDAIMMTFPLTKGSRTIVVSRELVLPMIELLQEQHLRIAAVSPGFAFGELVPADNQLTVEQGATLAAHLETALQYNLLPKEQVERALYGEEDFLSVRIDKKLIGMIALFVLLLALLGGLVWWQQRQDASTAAPAPVVQQAQPAGVAATPTPVPSAVPSPAIRTLVQVSAPVQTEFVSLLMQDLEASGYFTAEFIQTTQPGGQQAVIPTSLPLDFREALLDILAASPTEFAIRETNSVEVITISIADTPDTQTTPASTPSATESESVEP